MWNSMSFSDILAFDSILAYEKNIFRTYAVNEPNKSVYRICWDVCLSVSNAMPLATAKHMQ